MSKKIVVIGGGAAGLMAAITAGEAGAAVTLLEPNERLGKKVNITGKGRCNVTNNCSQEDFLAHVPHNGRFLYGAISRFNSQDTMAFFEKLGVPLKTERGNRVFPQSDSAFDITDALRRRLHQLHIPWVHDRATAILHEDQHVTGVRGEKDTYSADAVILATGGVSYPATGSTGDGYQMASALGHSIISPRGSLVPLESDETCCGKMQGLALRNVEVTAYNQKNKIVFKEFGEMLFTHFGVSGPLILSLSAHLRNWDKDRYRLEIDLKPALDEEKLEARILRDLKEQHNRDAEKIIAGLVPHSMVPVLMDKLAFPPELKANSVTRQQRRALIDILKKFPISLTGPRPVQEAIVTSGGIKVSEVQPATMESKKTAGLYFAGEILDVDAYTGGFNLQIAWSTGRAAGTAAAENKEQ